MIKLSCLCFPRNLGNRHLPSTYYVLRIALEKLSVQAEKRVLLPTYRWLVSTREWPAGDPRHNAVGKATVDRSPAVGGSRFPS